MSLEKDVETKVELVLKANTVQKATEIVRSRYGTAILAVISFIEAALPLPLLTDPFLVAAILIHKEKAVRLVFVTIVASVFGGACAYFMALFFLDSLLQQMTPGIVSQFNAMVEGNDSNTLALTLLGAVTPIPYTLVAWVVAVLHGSLLVFILGSFLGRGFRYGVVGYSTYHFGSLAISYARKYIGIASLLMIIVLAVYVFLKM